MDHSTPHEDPTPAVDVPREDAAQKPDPQPKRPFVQPELRKHDRLPRVTHGFAGSFPP